MLHSGNIKQAIMDDRNKKSLNPIEIMEEDVADTKNVPDPSEYMQSCEKIIICCGKIIMDGYQSILPLFEMHPSIFCS